MRRPIVTLLFISAMVLLWGIADYADARRAGGGRSFGSRPQYNQSSPTQSRSQPSQGQAGQSASTQRRPGLLGGMGGMLGGLLMGGLIGSLLFGGHGGGVGLLDLVIIGGGLFLLLRFLKTRRAATQTAGPMNFQSASPEVEYVPSAGGGFGPAGQPAVELPSGFDEAEFMKGARAAYQRVQSSWDKRDMEDLRQFTSREVWEEMNRQAQDDPVPGTTEIIRLNAGLQKVEHMGTHTVVSVLFDVLMREDPNQETASQVQEIWHFSRDESVPGSFWLLEGIQQVG